MGRLAVVEQLSFALAESQTVVRDLTTQLGAANATIATLSITNHRALHPPPISVRALFLKFSRAYEGHPSWRIIRARLLRFVWAFRARAADGLTARDWPAFREKRLKVLGKLTVNHELGWVKRLYNWALDEEQALVSHNPFARVKRIKCKKNRETWIGEEDARCMLDAPAPRKRRPRMILRAFLLVMLDCGLRFNEARRLRRTKIREAKNGRIVVDVGRTKNGKPHLVALTARAFEALAELEPVGGFDGFFVSLRRRRGSLEAVPALYSERQMRRWFREMCLASGVDAKVADGDVRLRPHDLRHSAATLAHRRGASLKAVSRMLNHSSVSITARYIHDEEDDALEIAELMEAGIRREALPRPGRRKAPHRAAPPHMDVTFLQRRT